MNPHLSVIAPVFTDEVHSVRYAAEVLGRSAEAAAGDNYEILFADDGSAPCTRDALDALARADRRIRLIGNGCHHGLGRMFRWALEEARGEFALYTDGDGQVACSELARVWPSRGDCDLVLGYRTGRREGLVRNAGTVALSFLASVFLGRRYQDVDCAFKFARADFLRSLGLRCRGVGIDAEILLMARRRSARILEIPVAHTPPRGRKSRVTPGRILYGACEFLMSAMSR